MNRVIIPLELIDHIIDHLHDEKRALRVCSLVSKVWRLRCSHHLFSDLEVYPGNAPKILAFLRSPHCDIATAVTRLVVVHYHKDIVSAGLFDSKYCSMPAANDELLEIALLVRAVKSLRLHSSPDVDFRLPSSLPPLREIEIVNTAFGSEADAFLYIGTFSPFSILSLDNIQCTSEEHSSAVPGNLVSSHGIRTLRSSGQALCSMVKVIANNEPQAHVRSLDCCAYEPRRSQDRNMLFQCLGPSLESLCIDFEKQFERFARFEDKTGFVDISACRAIESLSLINVSPGLIYGDWPFRVISQLTSNNLQQLELHFQWPLRAPISMFGWAALSDALAGPRFANLRTFIIHCHQHTLYGHGANDSIHSKGINHEEELRICQGPLSDLYRRGILRFDRSHRWCSAVRRYSSKQLGGIKFRARPTE